MLFDQVTLGYREKDHLRQVSWLEGELAGGIAAGSALFMLMKTLLATYQRNTQIIKINRNLQLPSLQLFLPTVMTQPNPYWS